MKEFDDALKVLREEGKKLPKHLSIKQLKIIAREVARKEALGHKRARII